MDNMLFDFVCVRWSRAHHKTSKDKFYFYKKCFSKLLFLEFADPFLPDLGRPGSEFFWGLTLMPDPGWFKKKIQCHFGLDRNWHDLIW